MGEPADRHSATPATGGFPDPDTAKDFPAFQELLSQVRGSVSYGELARQAARTGSTLSSSSAHHVINKPDIPRSDRNRQHIATVLRIRGMRAEDVEKWLTVLDRLWQAELHPQDGQDADALAGDTSPVPSPAGDTPSQATGRRRLAITAGAVLVAGLAATLVLLLGPGHSPDTGPPAPAASGWPVASTGPVPEVAPDPPLSGPVAAPSGTGTYKTTADGDVWQWSGRGTTWQRIGVSAKKLYAGPAGVFAVGLHDDVLRGYTGRPGHWVTVSEPAADFAISTTRLYRLAKGHSAVHEWNAATRTWKKIKGPAQQLYGGGAGLFATDPEGGRISLYSGTPGRWDVIGTAGADFAVTGDSLYGLDLDKTQVRRWSGHAFSWSRAGGAATRLYAGRQGLYASNPQDGILWQYSGTPDQWYPVSAAGADFALRGTALYRLAADRSGIWRRDPATQDWQQISGPARTLTAAG
ncbi:hypothetical protein [Streptomyces sp. NPDC014733]|uniref:hypothetical protein n=1 Tax=Streptomyces sp. NPDC014733 TaxID=3364885 RepID=UPI0036F86069